MKSLSHSRRKLLLASVLPFVPGLVSAQMHGPSAPVQGQVVSRASTPIPGLAVYLVHPALGRSAPTFTDMYGRFGWTMIPLKSDPYYIEVYWGNRVVYRNTVSVQGPLVIPPISL